MLDIIKLIILFFVLFDPLASLAVFVSSTRDMDAKERRKTAFLAVLVAFLLSVVTLLLGESMLALFNTNIHDFRIAGGIILVILGIRMTLGYPLLHYENDDRENSSHAVAALVATPLLTGPAVITSIIVLKHDYGIISTTLSIFVVLFFTAILFFNGERIHRLFGKKITQVISTILGLIIIAWGVGFFRQGIGI